MKFNCDSCGARFQIADEKVGPKGAKVRCKKCGAMIRIRPPEADAAEPSADLAAAEADGTLSDETSGLSEEASGLSEEASGLLEEASGLSDEASGLLDAVGSVEAELPPFDEAEAARDRTAPAAEAAPPTRGSLDPESATNVDGESTSAERPPAGVGLGLDLDDEPGSTSDGLGQLQERNELLEMQTSLIDELGGDLGIGSTTEPGSSHDPAQAAAEIGSAFEAMFAPETSPGGASVAETTQPGATDAKNPAEVWYVSVCEEQTGPISAEDLTERWNRSELGPETLCWREGMGDWRPIAEVEEFRALPGIDERPRQTGSGEDLSYEGMPTFAAMAAGPSRDGAASAEVSADLWKPSAASALDSLAAEEIAEAKSGRDADAASPFGGFGTDLTTSAEASPVSPAAAAPYASAAAALPSPAAPVTLPPAALPPRRPRALLWVAGAVVLLSAAAGAYAVWGPGGGAPPLVTAADPGTPTPTAAIPDPGSDAPVPAVAPDASTADAGSVAPDAGVPDASPPDAVAPPPKKPAKVARRTTRRKPPRRRSRPSRPQTKTSEDDLLGSHGSKLPTKLSDQEVLRVLVNHKQDIVRCLSEQKNADPSLQGQMTVKLQITGEGRPTRVNVVPARFRDAVVGRCVIRSVKRWRFPRFSGDPIPLDFPVVVRGG